MPDTTDALETLQPLRYRLVDDGLELSFDERFTLSHDLSGQSLSFHNKQVNILPEDAMEELLDLLLGWKAAKRQQLIDEIEEARQLKEHAANLEEELQAQLEAEDTQHEEEAEPALPDVEKLRAAIREGIQEHTDRANELSDKLLVTLGHDERAALQAQMKEHLARANELAQQLINLS